MKQRIVADLSRLPLHGMGAASVTWWGTLAFMLIEGTGFALAIAVYLYLMAMATTWPIDARAPICCRARSLPTSCWSVWCPTIWLHAGPRASTSRR